MRALWRKSETAIGGLGGVPIYFFVAIPSAAQRFVKCDEILRELLPALNKGVLRLAILLLRCQDIYVCHQSRLILVVREVFG